MKCPLCERDTGETTFLGGYDIHFCKNCNHYFAKSNMDTLQNHNVYESYEYSLEKLRMKNYTTILNVVEKYLTPGASGLEVGSALGWFLKMGSARGYRMTGVEPIIINYEKSLSPEYTVYNGIFPDCLDVNVLSLSFDFIIFNDVREHISDACQLYRDCNTLLKDNGILIINLPMSSDSFFKIARFISLIGRKQSLTRLWQFETESPHLHYYSHKSIVLSAKNNGFTLNKVFSLETLDLNFSSIHERVQGIGKINPFIAKIVSFFIFAGVPLLKILPKDIKCFVFSKESLA